jgi:hypothetical protein
MGIAFAALLLAMGRETLPSPGRLGSHEAWVQEVKSSDVRALQAALGTFDAYSRRHPSDAVAAVERCKLIAAATNRDDEEPPDPQLPTLHDCLTGLEEAFPDSAVAAFVTRRGSSRRSSMRAVATTAPAAAGIGASSATSPRSTSTLELPMEPPASRPGLRSPGREILVEAAGERLGQLPASSPIFSGAMSLFS